MTLLNPYVCLSSCAHVRVRVLHVCLPATVGREADPAPTSKQPRGPGTGHDESHG